jgi:hypothetical protein
MSNFLVYVYKKTFLILCGNLWICFKWMLWVYKIYTFSFNGQMLCSIVLMSNSIETMSFYASIATSLWSSILNHSLISFWFNFTFFASKQDTFVCSIINKSHKNTCISPTNNIFEVETTNGHLACSPTTFHFPTFIMWITHSPSLSTLPIEIW